MKVHRDINYLPAFQHGVVTIGTFDGVHEGHQKILAQMRKEAEVIGGETVIITFHPHPRTVVAPDQPSIQLLNTIDEKIELLDFFGMDHLAVVPFSQQFSQMAANEYIEDFLYRKFLPHTVIIGYDHHFGQGRSGNYLLLEKYAEKLGFRLKEISPLIINEITVSSTRIRKALSGGDIQTANSLLGYDYFFSGKVVQGQKVGASLGYPTANLEIGDKEKLIPGNGVYAVEVQIPDEKSGAKGSRLKGMMNIGFRPTLQQSHRTIEVNIFDFTGNLYSQTIRVFIKSFIRSEKKFDGLEALQKQLTRDKQSALQVLA